MKIVERIRIEELKKLAENKYEPLVKAVIDTGKDLLVVDIDLSIDGEHFLLLNGSKQADL